MTQNNPLGKSGVVTTALETTVDVRPQLLRVIRPLKSMILRVPSLLPSEAQIVMQTMFMCFDKNKNISEGQVKDIVFGFAQKTADTMVIPPNLTLTGLKQLHTQGYIKFQGPDNSHMSPESDMIGEAWVRYQPKLLELVYEDTSSK